MSWKVIAACGSILGGAAAIGALAPKPLGVAVALALVVLAALAGLRLWDRSPGQGRKVGTRRTVKRTGWRVAWGRFKMTHTKVKSDERYVYGAEEDEEESA